jgi:transposase InsO family protein
VTVIAANAHRYPISAQCRILGVARSTYYRVRSHPAAHPSPDPLEADVVRVFEANRSEYGARKIKSCLVDEGKVVSRRRIGRIMRKNGLTSAYRTRRFRQPRSKVNCADVPNVLDRRFSGRAPHTHVASDLTYVRVGSRWDYVCLLIDMSNREIVGHSAGEHKDVDLVMASFASVGFPLYDMQVYHTDRGSEFDNHRIDEMLSAFGIERSLSRRGCPYDNAVVESTNHILKTEFVYRHRFSTLGDLRTGLNDYVHWYNNFRKHSTLGYLTPVEFKERDLGILSK